MAAEEPLEFIDTNVLLYAYDRSAGARHERAAALVGDLGAGRHAAVSVQVLQEFYVNITRKIAEPLDHEVALDRLRVLSHWPLHVPQASDVVGAAQLAQSSKLSFWDAMIIRSAGALGCQTLWSEDLNDGQRISGVTVRNPFQHGV
ncbi:MAG: PIN domain-containing protein [Actinomycetota bacterium]|nr:PIN domain-containing protein [Actinomycetota bacterium]